MYMSARWSGGRLRSAIRLALGSALAAVVIGPEILDVPRNVMEPYKVAVFILWILLAGIVVATLVAGHFSRRAWVQVIATLIFLTTSIVSYFDLLGQWSSEVEVTGFIIFYLFELRGIVRSNPAVYASLALAGVVALASVSMAGEEDNQPGATITTSGKALLWGLGQVFKFGALVDDRPVTSTGEFLGLLVILSGVLFSAVLLSTITAWAVRQSSERNPSDSVRKQVMQALIDTGLVVDPWVPPGSSPVGRVFVDVDHFVGSDPRNWLRSRVLATRDLLDELENADLAALPGSGSHRRQLVAVLEGPLGKLAEDGGDDNWNFACVDAGTSADDWILRHATPQDVVVTGNASLRTGLDEKGVPTVSWTDVFPRDVTSHSRSAALGEEGEH